MSRQLRKCLVSMIKNCVICRFGNWRQRKISFSQSQAKQLFRHPIRLRDFRNFLECSRKFHRLGDIKRRNQHVVTLPNFSHQPSGSEVLRLSLAGKSVNFNLFRQNAWHRRSSKHGRGVWNGNLRFSSRDRSVDEFDHQYILLQQGNFPARNYLQLFGCKLSLLNLPWIFPFFIHTFCIFIFAQRVLWGCLKNSSLLWRWFPAWQTSALVCFGNVGLISELKYCKFTGFLFSWKL